MSSKRRVNDSNGTAIWIRIGGAAVIAVGTIVWWFGRPTYPEVSSAENLQMMRALYTACSSQNVDRLTKWREKFAAVERNGTLTDQERLAFQAILDTAAAGDWQLAAAESYRFAQDQIR